MPAHSPSEVLAAGQRIGPFVLLTPLGSGGSGRVWAAARVGQLGFTKLMALKVLRQDKLSNPRARRRFEREARLGAQLIHPNVRVVHDLGMHEGRPYMAMRWVDTSLDELLRTISGNKLDPEVACWLGLQCCAALSAAHGFMDGAGRRCPIIHRDVSPGNILLTADGHVLLADLAAANDPTSALQTSTGAKASHFFGNLRYAAPEALKEQSLDGRADIFSLGCVLYEALSGSPPFDADNEPSLMFQVLEQGPADLAERAPELPPALVATVRRALARDVSERFPSADTLAEALSSCMGELSAFELEQRTGSLIREALGDKLRGREEAMYVAFRRFSVSQLERTDTLPIHQNPWPGQPPASAQTALGARGESSPSDGVVASTRARPSVPRVKVPLWLAAAALVLGLSGSLGLYQQVWRDPAGLASTANPPSASTRALEPSPPLEAAPQVPAATSKPDAGTPRASGSPPLPAAAPVHAATPPKPAPAPRRPRGAAASGAPTTRAGAPLSDAPRPAAPTRAVEPGSAYPALPPRIKTNPYKTPRDNGSGAAATD